MTELLDMAQQLDMLFDELMACGKTKPELVCKSIASVASLFSQPEDILQPDKLEDHIRRATLEAATTKERYNTTFQEQIAEIEFFHDSMREQVVGVRKIQNHVATSLKICSEAIQTTPPNFSTVRQISFSDTDMKRVLYLLQREKGFLDEFVHSPVKEVLPVGSHLYLIYLKLHTLLDWKSKASLECQKFDSSEAEAPFAANLIKSRLELFFNPLSDIVNVFKSYWTDLTSYIIEVQTLEGATIYEPFSVDNDVVIRKDFNPFESIHWYSMYYNILSILGKIVNSRKDKTYRTSTQLDFIKYDHFINHWNSCIVSNVSKTFSEHRMATAHNETLQDLLYRINGPCCLGLLAWIYNFALSSFTTIFELPEDGLIFCLTFVSHLKTHLTQYLEYEQNNSIPPSDSLFFLSWLVMFHKRISSITSQLGVNGIIIPELMSNAQVEAIISQYVARTTSMVKEWLGNLLSAETEKITLRIGPPDEDRFGKYFASITGEVFLFLDQIINLGATCKNVSLLPRLINSVLVESLGSFQENLKNIYKKEMIKTYGSKCLDSPLKVKGDDQENQSLGLEYYGVSLVNSVFQWKKELEYMEKKLAPEVQSNNLVVNALNTSNTAFQELEDLGINLLNSAIFMDITPTIKTLYTSTWYQGSESTRPIDIICDTIDDFLSDYEHRLNFESFRRFCDVFFENIVRAILKKMAHKSSRFKFNKASELLRYDHGQLLGIISKFSETKIGDALAAIYPLITSTEKTILLAFYNLKREYPDLSVSFFENILMRRDDLDKSIVKGLVNIVKEQLKKNKPAPSSQDKHSIFAEL